MATSKYQSKLVFVHRYKWEADDSVHNFPKYLINVIIADQVVVYESMNTTQDITANKL